MTLLFRRDLQLARAAQREAEQFDRVERLTAEIVQLLTDGETGTRGYVLTGRDTYLDPYLLTLQRIPAARADLRGNLRNLPVLPFHAQQMDEAVDMKLRIIMETVDLYRGAGPQAALALVNSDRGKRSMDRVRALAAEAREVTRRATRSRVQVREATTYRAMWMSILAGASASFLLGLAYWRLGRSLATEQKLSADLAAQETRYRDFASNLQNTHEEERASMARKVHDEIGQNLTAAKIDIILALRRLDQDPDGQRNRLSRTTELLDQTVQIARNLSMELRPAILDQAGLLAAADWQVHEFQTRTGIAVSWNAESSEPALSRDTKLALFRVLQEALTNVSRHAHATSVAVAIQPVGHCVELTVQDDGAGMDLQASHHRNLGIFGMRERLRTVGGELLLDSAPGQGTRVTARVPIPIPVEAA
ncbi:MAG: CHASE3 domain-containing protein [Bryobacterales bacterium]|nr:CHASE3 domain-containing protein [Bryobacterales bacterium]